MPSFSPPLKNTAYTTYISLVSQTNSFVFQANPTLAAGDVQIAIDDGAPANIATLPVVDADFTKRLKVVLSAAEMNGDNITIIFSDQADDEWCDLVINIPTAAVQFDTLADAVLDEAITEPGGVFVWGGATLRNIVGWLGALARNKMTQDDTGTILRDDADVANIASASISESGGLFTRGEWT